jgi:hypothetical protein
MFVIDMSCEKIISKFPIVKFSSARSTKLHRSRINVVNCRKNLRYPALSVIIISRNMFVLLKQQSANCFILLYEGLLAWTFNPLAINFHLPNWLLFHCITYHWIRNTSDILFRYVCVGLDGFADNEGIFPFICTSLHNASLVYSTSVDVQGTCLGRLTGDGILRGNIRNQCRLSELRRLGVWPKE